MTQAKSTISILSISLYFITHDMIHNLNMFVQFSPYTQDPPQDSFNSNNMNNHEMEEPEGRQGMKEMQEITMMQGTNAPLHNHVVANLDFIGWPDFLENSQ